MDEQEKNVVYTISEQADSFIDKNVETMDEWMTLMGDEELAAYHRMCNQDPDNRSDKENYEISKYAIILYCRELGLTELAITPDLMSKITGTFAANIIIESLRRQGYAKIKGPLLIYKDTTINLTKKGKKHLIDTINTNDHEDEN